MQGLLASGERVHGQREGRGHRHGRRVCVRHAGDDDNDYEDCDYDDDDDDDAGLLLHPPPWHRPLLHHPRRRTLLRKGKEDGHLRQSFYSLSRIIMIREKIFIYDYIDVEDYTDIC